MRAAGGRRADGVAVTGLIHSFHQITRLLKFNRQEVSRRNINALHVDALWVRAARSDLVRPKVPAARIRIAAEKIVVVFLHIESRLIDGIRRRGRCVVVGDGNHRRVRGAQGCSDRIAQGHEKELVSFDVRIVNNQHIKRLARLAGGEVQRAEGDDVV